MKVHFRNNKMAGMTKVHVKHEVKMQKQIAESLFISHLLSLTAIFPNKSFLTLLTSLTNQPSLL